MAFALAAAPGAADDAAQGAPARVVSMNLCTDQLAMMIAAEGQLVSVSHLAFDPLSSAMAEEAAAYHRNHGLAEEIYLLRPDLVLAGQYSDRATVSMLRRLGIEVVELDVVTSLDDVAALISAAGAALHREARATELVRAYERRLARLRAESGDLARRPRAALYFANGYTLGDGSLAGQILLTAGLANVASETGITRSGTLPLELLVLSAPQALITGTPYPGASRSEEILRHPVVARLRRSLPTAGLSDRDWICGTPHVLTSVEDMAGLRRRALARGADE